MTVTCEFAELGPGEAVPRFCLAPGVVAVRWRYLGDPEMHYGALCLSHTMIGCDQLMADPEVIDESVQVTRMD